MTPAAQERLAAHPPRSCESPKDVCGRVPVAPQLGRLDQSQGKGIDAAVYECLCGWKRSEPLRGAA